MKAYSSGIGSQLINDLRVASRDPFHVRARTILEAVFPSVRATFEMKSVDNAGIDDCTLVSHTDAIEDAYQFKGFENLELDNSHVNQCRGSIEALVKSSLSVKRYFLVINRKLSGHIRESLEIALKLLVKTGKAESVALLDLEAFLDAIWGEAKRQITDMLKKSAIQFHDLHTERMDEDFYLEDAPFEADKDLNVRENPVIHAAWQIKDLWRDPTNKRSWSFIIGEFGFGKTSLALRLADTLNREGLRCIYIPIAQFSENAFDNEYELMWTLLNFLEDGEASRDRLRDRILAAAFKEMLKSDKSCVIIVDGIDEHPMCWRENGLRNLFDVFKSFNAFCVFAMREEFFAERAGTFDSSLRKAPLRRCFVRLRSWPDSLILTFTQERERRLSSELARNNLEVFKQAVASEKYADLFGDIPKRPLFLKMLLDRIADKGVHAIGLADLYLEIFIAKFSCDLETSAPRPVVSRPLNILGDRNLICAQLLTVTTRTAGIMIRVKRGQLEMMPMLPSSLLMACLNQWGIEIDLTSILLHSVLVPAGRRAAPMLGGELNITFAHRSYQEFFTARYLFEVHSGAIVNPTVKKITPVGLVAKFLAGMQRG